MSKAALPLSGDNSMSSNREDLISVNITHSYKGIAHSPQKDKMHVHMRKYDDLYDKIGLKRKKRKTHVCLCEGRLSGKRNKKPVTVTASR